MSLFNKKKAEDGAEPTGEVAAGGSIAPTPEKATQFFDRAKTVHDTGSYEYAMTLWLNGLRHDPASKLGLDGFWASATAFVTSTVKPKLSRETVRSFTGKGPVEKYLDALLGWGVHQLDASLAVKALEQAAALHEFDGVDMGESGNWLTMRALALITQDNKSARANKGLYVKVMEACKVLGVYDLAVKAGELAVQIDPTDAELSNAVRNMSARATMSSGGYDKTGEQGGFRSNIRDAKKQQLMEDQDRIVKTEDVKDRLVRAAEEAYKERPDDMPGLDKYVKALLDRGRPEDEKLAMRLLVKAHEDTKQFRYRQRAGEIRLRQARRALSDYRARAEAGGSAEADRQAYAQAQRKFLEMERDEYRLRVEQYPTDLTVKHELGKREFELGAYEEAVGLFQQSKDDPKLRSAAMNYLGQAFLQMDWIDEAIDTYRAALEQHGAGNDPMTLELKYGLMRTLQAQADRERSLELATEAEKIASSIAIQQLTYRDIKDRRDQLKKLVATLKQQAAS